MRTIWVYFPIRKMIWKNNKERMYLASLLASEKVLFHIYQTCFSSLHWRIWPKFRLRLYLCGGSDKHLIFLVAFICHYLSRTLSESKNRSSSDVFDFRNFRFRGIWFALCDFQVTRSCVRAYKMRIKSIFIIHKRTSRYQLNRSVGSIITIW